MNKNYFLAKALTPMTFDHLADVPDTAKESQPLLRADHLNVNVSMPCPLKVPFQQLFSPFVEQWNADKTHLPIFCPMVNDCATEDLDQMIRSALTPKDLPDIYITSGYDELFSEKFHSRFLETGWFGGFHEDLYTLSYPKSTIEAAQKYHVGFLGFSSWGLVRDTSFKGEIPIPARWSDLVLPKFKGLVSIHGCHGHAGSLSMLLSLQTKGGDTALEKLADNIYKARHFSELIKGMNTSNSATPFYIMPNSAIAHIPSVKHAELLELEEGILTPMMLIMKQSKAAECEGIIRFFTDSGFRNMLAGGAYFQPDKIPGIDRHAFSDLDLLSKGHYEKYEKLVVQFAKMLGDKLKQA
jgi:hypothetical protein